MQYQDIGLDHSQGTLYLELAHGLGSAGQGVQKHG